jgi:serine/threonine-protein kinase RsbW
VKYELKIPCSREELKNVREFLDKIMDSYDVPGREANAMILAVDEVCANLIIHAHNCNITDHIDLHVTVKNDREFTFEIFDYAKGFDISQYKEPTLNALIQAKKKGGVGLILVRKIMDSIKLEEKDGLSIYRLHKSFD